MSNILCIETATPLCSVALWKEEKVAILKELDEFNSHSEVLTSFIADVLTEGDLKVKELDAIAVSNGPGSYTGLRIGAATAKGLSFASGVPIITVDTIESLAVALQKRNQQADFFAPMIDARRMEVYTTIYGKNLKTIQSLSPVILDEANWNVFFENKILAIGGTGARKAKEYFNNKNVLFDQDIKCSAAHLGALAQVQLEKKNFADLAYFEPNYLKEFTGK